MKLLVTGGGGFLGQALCRGLVERGHEVASFNRGHYPGLDALGVRQLRGDLADAGAVLEAAWGAAAADFLASGFELRFDERHDVGALADQRRHGRQDVAERDD